MGCARRAVATVCGLAIGVRAAAVPGVRTKMRPADAVPFRLVGRLEAGVVGIGTLMRFARAWSWTCCQFVFIELLCLLDAVIAALTSLYGVALSASSLTASEFRGVIFCLFRAGSVSAMALLWLMVEL